MTHRIRNPLHGDHPRHFLRVDFADYSLDPTERRVAPTWTSQTYRRRDPGEMRVLPNGLVVVGDGIFALSFAGVATAPGLQPIDPWRIQLYVENMATRTAVGMVQLTQLGPFTKMLAVPGNASYRIRPHSFTGKVKKAVLPNRQFQAGDIVLTELLIEARNVSLDPTEELATPPDVEVA